MRAFVYTVPETAGGRRSAVSCPIGKQDVNDSIVGTLAERKSIRMPLAFKSTTTILPESEEATMDDLNKIEVRIDPSFSTPDKISNLPFDKLINFELVYDGKPLLLVDDQFDLYLPKGVLGKGAMGVVAAYKLPLGKQIALKLETLPTSYYGDSEITLADVTPVLDKRCAVQSPVKDITPLIDGQKGKGLLSYISFFVKKGYCAKSYDRAYVMPRQSGDGSELFKLLYYQCNSNHISLEQYCRTMRELFADLARQVFCVLKEGYLVEDLKPDNFLYRITEQQEVRIMISDWGLWKSAPDNTNPTYSQQVGGEAPRLTYYVYFLVARINFILALSVYTNYTKWEKLQVDVDEAYSTLVEKLNAAKKTELSDNEQGDLKDALELLEDCHSIAYFFNRVLREHSDEVELTKQCQVRFL